MPTKNATRPTASEPSATSAIPPDPEELARWKHLTETALPAQARAQQWPIHFDHCFKRITLDHAFGDVWYKHLLRPAERHIHGAPLARAVACGEEILDQGLPALEKHNAASLKWRGKAFRCLLRMPC